MSALREAGNQLQAFALGKSEQQVHVLYCLTGSAFYEIVQCTHHNDASGTLVNDKVDVHVVAAFHPLGLGAAALIQYADKLLVCIIFIIDSLYLFICRKCAVRFSLQCCLFGCQDPPVHGYEVRGKIDGHLTVARIA